MSAKLRHGKSKVPHRTLPIATLAVLVIATLATVHSYFHSVSVAFCDATICTDEGAVSLQIPLVRFAHDQTFRTELLIYRRGEHVWEHSSAARKSTLQGWMAQADEEWFKGASYAKFGYWRGDWQNDSRPGPFIVIFVPIWSVTLVLGIGFVVIRHYRIKWSFRMMLILVCIAGIGLRLLTLREPV